MCFKYLQYKDTNIELADDYLSAIICRFYPKVYKNFYNQTKQYVSETDCYDWLTTAVLYVLDSKVWENPNSSLYGDPLAPEKAIYIKMNGAKLNHWTASMRQKRKLTTESISLDELSENASEDFYVPYYDQYSFFNDYIIDMVRNFFKIRDYFPAFMLDLILTANVFDKDLSGDVSFNDKRLKHYMLNINDEYCKIFSDSYNLSYKSVKRASDYVKSMRSDDVTNKILELKRILSKNQELLFYLKD